MVMRKCTVDDLDLLIRIGRETYYDTFHEDNTEQVMNDYLETAFQRDKILTELMNRHSFFYLVIIDQVPAAYLKINLKDAQTDLNDIHACEIERIYVQKDFKGQGLGTLLINVALDLAKEEDCPYAWLGVWENNHKAKSFYEALGFYKIGSHIFHMGDDPQTDILLRKDLKG